MRKVTVWYLPNRTSRVTVAFRIQKASAESLRRSGATWHHIPYHLGGLVTFLKDVNAETWLSLCAQDNRLSRCLPSSAAWVRAADLLPDTLLCFLSSITLEFPENCQNWGWGSTQGFFFSKFLCSLSCNSSVVGQWLAPYGSLLFWFIPPLSSPHSVGTVCKAPSHQFAQQHMTSWGFAFFNLIISLVFGGR